MREHKNVYGKGITPHFNAQNEVVKIHFSDLHTREFAESWLAEHEFSTVTIDEIAEEIKPTARSLAFEIGSTGDRIERNGQGMTIKGVKLLSQGVWTDSMQKTPWRVTPSALERHAANWTDTTVWNRHAGGQHRAVTDKIGNVQNVRYDNGSVIGDVNLHGITQNSRDAAALVDAGEINFVSVETLGSDKWNVGTKEFEAQDITFTGLALVNRGACTVCKLRENSEPIEEATPPVAEPETEPAAEEPIPQDPTMTPEEIAAIKADMMKELSATYDGKIRELTDELAAAKKTVKELSEVEAPPKSVPPTGDSRELATPEGYRIEIDSEGNVCRVI